MRVRVFAVVCSSRLTILLHLSFRHTWVETLEVLFSKVFVCGNMGWFIC